MNFAFIWQVILVLIAGNLLPVFATIPLFKSNILPKSIGILVVPAIVVISSYIRTVLGFDPKVNKIANIFGGVMLFGFIFLSEKYKWLDPKEQDKG